MPAFLLTLLRLLPSLLSLLRIKPRRKSSGRLQITVSGMVETSSESQESINSNQELGLRTDSNVLNEKPTDLPRKKNKF